LHSSHEKRRLSKRREFSAEDHHSGEETLGTLDVNRSQKREKAIGWKEETYLKAAPGKATAFTRIREIKRTHEEGTGLGRNKRQTEEVGRRGESGEAAMNKKGQQGGAQSGRELWLSGS